TRRSIGWRPRSATSSAVEPAAKNPSGLAQGGLLHRRGHSGALPRPRARGARSRRHRRDAARPARRAPRDGRRRARHAPAAARVGLPAAKSEVIYSGTDVARFHPGVVRAPLRRELGLAADHFDVTQVGVRSWRGWSDVLASMQRVAAAAPAARLLFIGAPPPA